MRRHPLIGLFHLACFAASAQTCPQSNAVSTLVNHVRRTGGSAGHEPSAQLAIARRLGVEAVACAKCDLVVAQARESDRRKHWGSCRGRTAVECARQAIDWVVERGLPADVLMSGASAPAWSIDGRPVDVSMCMVEWRSFPEWRPSQSSSIKKAIIESISRRASEAAGGREQIAAGWITDFNILDVSASVMILTKISEGGKNGLLVELDISDLGSPYAWISRVDRCDFVAPIAGRAIPLSTESAASPAGSLK